MNDNFFNEKKKKEKQYYSVRDMYNFYNLSPMDLKDLNDKEVLKADIFKGDKKYKKYYVDKRDIYYLVSFLKKDLHLSTNQIKKLLKMNKNLIVKYIKNYMDKINEKYFFLQDNNII